MRSGGERGGGGGNSWVRSGGKGGGIGKEERGRYEGEGRGRLRVGTKNTNLFASLAGGEGE